MKKFVIKLPKFTFVKRLKKRVSPISKRLSARPVTTVGTLFALLFAFMIVSSFLKKPKAEPTDQAQAPKQVDAYSIGQAPTVTVPATVEKDHVITIVAQSGGVIQKVNVKEGQELRRGQSVVWMSSTYAGGNAFSIQRQLASKQLEQIESTLPLQKEVINKQRDIARTSDTNNDELRKITDQSLAETRTVIDLNDTILNTLNQNLDQYIATNSAGVNDTAILQTRQLKSQLLSGQSQLRSALRANEYQSSNDKAPAQLSDQQKDLAIKQLDLQEKSLDLSKEIAELQVKLARVNEGLMYPVTPFAGTVQQVHVHSGEAVNPGQPLITISGSKQSTSLVASVPFTLAQRMSRLEASKLQLNGKTVELFPSFIATENGQGGLVNVRYQLLVEYSAEVGNQATVNLQVPVGYAQTSSTIPYLPLDSIYQSNAGNFVYVIGTDNLAEVRTVELGSVYGSFVEVKSGLNAGDQIILNRTVISGDRIEVK